MQSLSQKEEQQVALNQSPAHSQFACNICRRMAEEPVVTKCGHLFCWECVHNSDGCVVCRAGIMEEDFVPIYTAGQDRMKGKFPHQIKPKPKARQVGKIKNSTSLGSTNSFSSLYISLNDNIQRQSLLAGNGYSPATVFTLMGQQDQELEELEGKGTERKITVMSWFLLIVVLGCVMLAMQKDKDGR